MHTLFSNKKIFLYPIILCTLIIIAGSSYVLFHKHKTNNIPHIIHYVWFGEKDPPQNVKNAITTWKKNMPGWEIKRWNEKNCNINANKFIQTHFNQKNYNFSSDYCRIYALEKEGGLYLDTDSIINKSVEPLLSEPLVLAKQDDDTLAASFVAGVPHHPFFKELLAKYDNNEAFNYHHAPQLFTGTFLKMFQTKLSTLHINKKFILYEPNVLILDFKGPENYAYHLYAQGTGNTDQCSGYCYMFQHIYLNTHAYRLTDKENEYILPTNNNQCYFVHLENNQWVSKTPYQTFPCSVLGKNDISYLDKNHKNVLYHCVNALGCLPAETLLDTKSYICQHPKWRGKIITYKSRAVNMLNADGAYVLEATPLKLCLKWDAYNQECFIWDETQKVYVLQQQ